MAYIGRGAAYIEKGQYEQALADFNQALEINPRLGMAYQGRAWAHFGKEDYDKAWQDVRRAQNLGQEIMPEFLQALRQASGRQN